MCAPAFTYSREPRCVHFLESWAHAEWCLWLTLTLGINLKVNHLPHQIFCFDTQMCAYLSATLHIESHNSEWYRRQNFRICQDSHGSRSGQNCYFVWILQFVWIRQHCSILVSSSQNWLICCSVHICGRATLGVNSKGQRYMTVFVHRSRPCYCTYTPELRWVSTLRVAGM